jgi:hypothetical protein
MPSVLGFIVREAGSRSPYAPENPSKVILTEDEPFFLLLASFRWLQDSPSFAFSGFQKRFP